MTKKKLYGEGSITHRKDGRYQVSVPGPDGGKRRYAYADSEKEAERLRRQLLAEVEQGKVPPSKQPFQTHYEEWLEVRKRDFKPNTYLNTTLCFNAHFLPAFGKVSLNRLSANHIQKLYGKLLDEGLNPNTIHTYHARLKICLKFAVKQGKIVTNPCDGVELPKKKKSKNGCLTAEEALMVIEACKHNRQLSTLVPLALASEARESELLALTWDDVDFERNLLRLNKTLTRKLQPDGKITIDVVTPKSESGIREILLPPFAMEALHARKVKQRKAALAAGKPQSLLVFPGYNQSGYLWPGPIVQRFEDIIAKLGLDITFHDLRHTGATLGLQEGISALEMQHRLGHATIQTTLGVYGHVTRKIEKQATNTLENLFSGEKNANSEAN